MMNLQTNNPMPPIPPMCHGLSEEVLTHIKGIIDEKTPGLVSLFSNQVARPARFECEIMPYTVEEATELYAKDVPTKMRDHLTETVLRLGHNQGEYDENVLKECASNAADEFVEQEIRRIRTGGRELTLVSRMITDEAVRPFLDKAPQIYALTSDVATAMAVSDEVPQQDLDEIRMEGEARCRSLHETAKGLYDTMLEHNRLTYASIMDGMTLCLDYIMGRTTQLPKEVRNDVSMRCLLHRMAAGGEMTTQ